MDELVKLVVKKTGMDEAMARKVVEIVIGFLKTKLPPPVASQVEAVLKGGQAGDLLKGVGGMLGR